MEDFLSKIAKIASEGLFGSSAEAKTIYANKEGKVPESMPIEYQYKSLSDVLGVEPKTYDEYKSAIKKQFNNMVKNGIAEGEALQTIEDRLLQVSLHKAGITDLRDLDAKFFDKLGISKEDQAKIHHIYMDQTGKVRPSGVVTEGTAHGVLRKSGSKPIPNITEGFKIPNQSSEYYDPENEKQFFGLPLNRTDKFHTGSYRLDSPKDMITQLGERASYEQMEPVAKVRYYNPKDAKENLKSAVAAAHENLHALNQLYRKLVLDKKNFFQDKYKTTKDQNIGYRGKGFVEGKDIMDEAMKNAAFSSHFVPVKMGESEEYLPYYVAAKILNPELVKDAENPFVVPKTRDELMEKYFPKPSPTPEPTATPIPEEEPSETDPAAAFTPAPRPSIFGPETESPSLFEKPKKNFRRTYEKVRKK